MGERASIGRGRWPLERRGLPARAGRVKGEWMRSHERDDPEVTGEGPVVASPTAPAVLRRVSVVEAARALDVSAATVRRRIRSGELAAERVVRHRGAAWVVTLPAAADAARPLYNLPPAGPSDAASSPGQTGHGAPDAGGGLALWCVMASLAEQLAAANARQALALRDLERDNNRLAVELERATSALATQADQCARASRRASRRAYGLALVVAGLGALLLVLGPLAAAGW